MTSSFYDNKKITWGGLVLRTLIGQIMWLLVICPPGFLNTAFETSQPQVKEEKCNTSGHFLRSLTAQILYTTESSDLLSAAAKVLLALRTAAWTV